MKPPTSSTVQLFAEGNDFLESSTWPIRSMDIVALLELEDFSKAKFILGSGGTAGVGTKNTPKVEPGNSGGLYIYI